MMYQNAEITKYFNEDTIHVLDYQFEYDKGFPDQEKFPEFNNKVFSKLPKFNQCLYLMNSF